MKRFKSADKFFGKTVRYIEQLDYVLDISVR